MAARRLGERGMWVGQAIAVAAIWLAVAAASIVGPVLVTGTDPTRIPLAALLGPIAGVIATGYVVVFVAVANGESEADAAARRADPRIGPAVRPA